MPPQPFLLLPPAHALPFRLSARRALLLGPLRRAVSISVSDQTSLNLWPNARNPIEVDRTAGRVDETGRSCRGESTKKRADQ